MHLHCGDLPGEWTLRMNAEGTYDIERAHAKGDCAIRGSASDILLALWRRRPASTVDIVGDADVAARFLAYPALEDASIAPGTHVVGAHIAPGTYVASARRGCYWERVRSFDGTSGGQDTRRPTVGLRLLRRRGPGAGGLRRFPAGSLSHPPRTVAMTWGRSMCEAP